MPSRLELQHPKMRERWEALREPAWEINQTIFRKNFLPRSRRSVLNCAIPLARAKTLTDFAMRTDRSLHKRLVASTGFGTKLLTRSVNCGENTVKQSFKSVGQAEIGRSRTHTANNRQPRKATMTNQTQTRGDDNSTTLETPEQKLERLTRQMVLAELNHRRAMDQKPLLLEIPAAWWQEHGRDALERARLMKVVTIISIWSRREESDSPVQYDVLACDGEVNETLEHAYVVTNLDGRPNGRQACSTTAGDMMVVDGKYYLVEAQGFHELTETEAQAIRQLHCLDTCWGYERIVQNHRI